MAGIQKYHTVCLIEKDVWRVGTSVRGSSKTNSNLMRMTNQYRLKRPSKWNESGSI